MRNMAVLHSPAFSYPLPVLVRVLSNLLIFKGKILYYNKYTKRRKAFSRPSSFILAAGTYAPAVVKLFEFSYRIFYNTDGFHEFHLVDHQRWGKTDNMLVGRFSQ